MLACRVRILSLAHFGTSILAKRPARPRGGGWVVGVLSSVVVISMHWTVSRYASEHLLHIVDHIRIIVQIEVHHVMPVVVDPANDIVHHESENIELLAPNLLYAYLLDI